MISTMKTRLAKSKIDLWDFYDHFEGREIECANLGVFLAFLHSEGTERAHFNGAHIGQRWAQIRICGPVADTGEPMTAHYKIYAGNVERLDKSEVRAMQERLDEVGQWKEATMKQIYAALRIP